MKMRKINLHCAVAPLSNVSIADKNTFHNIFSLSALVAFLSG